MGLFEQLSQVLGSSESLTLSIRKEGDQNLVVLIQPVINQMDEGSDEVQQIRAALAMPIRVIEKPEVLDNEFLDLLGKWSSTRTALASEDCFARFNETANAARVAAKKAATSEKKKERAAAPKQSEKSVASGRNEAISAVAAPTAPPKQPDLTPATNPDSLY